MDSSSQGSEASAGSVTMVERVAKALFGLKWKGLEPDLVDRCWAEARLDERGAEFFVAARLAVEAMREPTEAMLAASADPMWTFSQDYALIDKDPEGKREGSAEEVARRVFEAMIDAALTEPAPAKPPG